MIASESDSPPGAPLRWKSPGSSTKRAPSMCSARYLPNRAGVRMSPARLDHQRRRRDRRQRGPDVELDVGPQDVADSGRGARTPLVARQLLLRVGVRRHVRDEVRQHLAVSPLLERQGDQLVCELRCGTDRRSRRPSMIRANVDQSTIAIVRSG